MATPEETNADCLRQETRSPQPTVLATGTTGILLVGHGTRDQCGTADFHTLCRRVTVDFSPLTVEPSFLEISAPTVSIGVRRLINAGARQIVVAPLLLFAAGHARRDLPQAVVEALQPYPEVSWTQAQHLGCHPALLQQSAIRFKEAVASRASPADEPTLLVFVGRGSRDEQAIQEAHAFATATSQSRAVAHTFVCFYAMARPSLSEALERGARSGVARIVVQPHLLFEGQIAEAIRQQVRVAADHHPQIEWLTTQPLGPTELVAQAVRDAIRRQLEPEVEE